MQMYRMYQEPTETEHRGRSPVVHCLSFPLKNHLSFLVKYVACVTMMIFIYISVTFHNMDLCKLLYKKL